jgi:DNA modification methylase
LIQGGEKIVNLIHKSNSCELWNGDCIEIMRSIPGSSVDLILCDLPYGTTACKWDEVIPFECLWEQYNRISKENTTVVLFGKEPFSSKLRLSNLSNFKYDWIWVKDRSSNYINSKFQPLNNYETISVFNKMACTYSKKGNMPYNPQGLVKLDTPKKKLRSTARVPELYHSNPNVDTYQEYENYPKAIISFPLERKTIHPTQKPVALLEYLIRTYTQENDLVLDNCMGSGSTGVAALNTGRKFIGIELNPTYCDMADRRIQNLVSA